MRELLHPITESAAEISPCGVFRWSLTRGWGVGTGTVYWQCLNPSDADATRNDPSVLRMCAFSQRWGYRRMILGNLAPLRSSS
ncbi:MAG: DUF1643 domain-containing protein, partial [Alphaproteobacteria bacterium]|nr:DUF1643 domain-containing protein [Alphaproteobacteria bacterium]